MSHARCLSALRASLVLVVLVLLAGCWEQHQRIAVNPDGSARIEIERKISAQAVRQMGMGEQTDLEEAAREQAAEIVGGVQGVEAWTDVEWSVARDTLHFSGTAYVPDLTEYSFEDPEGENDRTITSLDVHRTGDGLTIGLAPAGDEGEDEEPLGSLTEKEAMEQARELQSEARRTRAMAATFFAGMAETIVLDLPSEPTEAEGFERRDDGTWAVTFHGDSLLAAMGGVLEMETSKLAAHIREGASEGKTRDQIMGDLMERRFGSVPARVVVSGDGEPSFDYEDEVADARKAFQGIKQRLGIQGDPGSDGGAADGGGAPDPGSDAGEAAAGAASGEPGAVGGAGEGGEAAPAAGGPPRPVRLSVGHPELAGSLELGTKLVITIPEAAGVRRLGLTSDAPRGLAITDDRGRDLVAGSQEAYEAWDEAHPNTFTTRGAATWSLTTVGDDPEIPAVEIELWATPSADARSLRVRGEVPVKAPPENTTTTTVPLDRVEDGAGIDLGGRTVTLSRYGTMTRGDRKSVMYEVEGGTIVTAVRRGDETLWEMGDRGSGRIAIPESLGGGAPLVFEHGEPSVHRIPVELEFGLGLGGAAGGG